MKQAIFKTQLVANTAEMIKNEGFNVFYTKWQHTKESPNSFFFTDGMNIGYCQGGYFGGVRFSTVHKPCRECGTGFGLNDDPGIYNPTIKDAKKAFIIAPNWAKRKDINAVRKYVDWEEYINSPINKMCQYIKY